MADYADSSFRYLAQDAPRMHMEDPRQKKAQSGDSEELFNRIFADQPKQSAATMADGRLSMKVPENWQRVEDGKLPIGVHSVGFRPKDNADIELNMYYRGHQLDEPSAKKFHELLAAPPHSPLTTDELKSVQTVLRDKANEKDFKILSAKTEKLNGITVLSIEGSYTNYDVRAQVKYVDSVGDGKVVQEISYTAPAKDYNNLKYLLDAEKSMKSLIVHRQ